ncbi:MAG: DUF624 domain-containing protein [Hungatella sp.]|nr:DUF624 domain-containing protein [Hungatella sp.]
MLSGLFNYDNPVWRFIGKFWDVLIVNLLWFICSIPIFTVGASTTAMYYVTLKLARDEDEYTIRSFFKSFKENFRQSTVIWLIFLLTGLLLAFDVYYFIRMAAHSTFRTVMISVFLAMVFIWMAMFTYVFPLQARFYNPVKRTIFNSFFMAVRHVFHTIGMLAVDVAILFLSVSYIPQLSIFGVALIAFFNSYMLNNVFSRYMPKREDPREMELRPLFADEEEAERKAEKAQTEE